MGKMRNEEFQEAIENLRIERVNSYGVSGRIISEWKLKTFLNGAEINLGDANAYIKANEKKYLPQDKEEALHSVESFLKEYFLQNTKQLEKSIKEGLKNN
jgi:hypothetical protein